MSTTDPDLCLLCSKRVNIQCINNLCSKCCLSNITPCRYHIKAKIRKEREKDRFVNDNENPEIIKLNKYIINNNTTYNSNGIQLQLNKNIIVPTNSLFNEINTINSSTSTTAENIAVNKPAVPTISTMQSKSSVFVKCPFCTRAILWDGIL